MKAIIIPFRILRFSVPQALMMQFLCIVANYDVILFINGISADHLFATVTLSIDLTKGYQCDAVILIKQLLATATVTEGIDSPSLATDRCSVCNPDTDHLK